jgi:hypothetical protein
MTCTAHLCCSQVKVEEYGAGSAIDLEKLDGTWRLNYTSAGDVVVLFEAAARLPFLQVLQLSLNYWLICSINFCFCCKYISFWRADRYNCHSLLFILWRYDTSHVFYVCINLHGPKKYYMPLHLIMYYGLLFWINLFRCFQIGQIYQNFECKDQTNGGIVRNVVRWSIEPFLEVEL